MFYCGDDQGAKMTVSQLIRETGFEPVDAGPLRSARNLEPLAMLLVQLGYVQGMGTNIALNLVLRGAGDNAPVSTETVSYQYILTNFNITIPPKANTIILGRGNPTPTPSQ